jgi:hypothetical protein
MDFGYWDALKCAFHRHHVAGTVKEVLKQVQAYLRMKAGVVVISIP